MNLKIYINKISLHKFLIIFTVNKKVKATNLSISSLHKIKYFNYHVKFHYINNNNNNKAILLFLHNTTMFRSILVIIIIILKNLKTRLYYQKEIRIKSHK